MSKKMNFDLLFNKRGARSDEYPERGDDYPPVDPALMRRRQQIESRRAERDLHGDGYPQESEL